MGWRWIQLQLKPASSPAVLGKVCQNPEDGPGCPRGTALFPFNNNAGCRQISRLKNNFFELLFCHMMDVFAEWREECERKSEIITVVFQGSLAALKSRTIQFSGQFVPVKWKCRAPLPNGRLCERMDRVKVRQDDRGVWCNSYECVVKFHPLLRFQQLM